MDLSALRTSLDDIDRQIVELYEKRMDVCAQVAAHKLESGKRVFDREREQQKLKAVGALTHNAFNEQGVKELFEQIMAMSRKLQYRIIAEHEGGGRQAFLEMEEIDREKCRVVFQGAEGSYSQAAMMEYFGAAVDCFNVDTFRDAMLAIDEGSADFAVLPIENSSAGIVSEIYDLLVEFENYIVGEQIIRIEHCLLASPGTRREDIRTVYSHPQSLMQTAHYLQDKGWQQISMKNNAFAARKVADERDGTQAAIAGAAAARIYGLDILERGINDLKGNSTRFIIVTNRKVFSRTASKISLCFEVNHESGALYHALSHLMYNGLNMTKIESRPLEGRNWEYRFFVDFEGNLENSAVRNALRGLREETRNMKILGNY
ncbi:MAG: prephenate dehydratase [Roseburia sp.]|nr:prephenate dehydratase [Roseburia sp.]